MRGIFILLVIIAILIGAGILHVTWKDGTASVTFDKEKAHERLEEARTMEANFEKNLHQQK